MERRTPFILTGLIALLALIPVWQRGESLLAMAAIGAAMLALFTYLAPDARKGTLIAAHALILLHSLGGAFNLISWSLAGVTYDTYLHLIGGYVTTALLIEYGMKKRVRHAGLIAMGVTMLLAIGLELVEAIDAFVLGQEICHGFCPYLQDTAKDIVNDLLGAVFAFLR